MLAASEKIHYNRLSDATDFESRESYRRNKMERRTIMMKLDFSNHPAAQDMIRIVMAKKGLSAKEAIWSSMSFEKV